MPATAAPSRIAPRFDAVLFDCDGVLVDSEPITNGVLRTMLGELGWELSPEECMRRFIGKALQDEIGVIKEHTGVVLSADWLLEFRDRRNEALERDLTEIPGAPAAVRTLATAFGGRIACASGADRAKMRLQLLKIGLLDAFGPQLYSGMETPRSKPAPDVYLAAAAGLGVDPARCAVVEDTVTGTIAGVDAGAVVYGYSPGGPAHSSPEALREAGVSAVFTHMDDLAGLLTAHR